MAESTHYLDDNSINDGSRNAFQLLKDCAWALRTKSGSILRAPITRYGPDGLPDGETSAEAEFGWNRENVAAINHRLDLILEKLEGK